MGGENTRDKMTTTSICSRDVAVQQSPNILLKLNFSVQHFTSKERILQTVVILIHAGTKLTASRAASRSLHSRQLNVTKRENEIRPSASHHCHIAIDPVANGKEVQVVRNL